MKYSEETPIIKKVLDSENATEVYSTITSEEFAPVEKELDLDLFNIIDRWEFPENHSDCSLDDSSFVTRIKIEIVQALPEQEEIEEKKVVTTKKSNKSRVPEKVRQAIRKIIKGAHIQYITMYSERNRIKFHCINMRQRDYILKVIKEIEKVFPCKGKINSHNFTDDLIFHFDC